MAKSIEFVAVCPFLNGKPCISDGLSRDVLCNGGTAYPCMFWDEYAYNGIPPTEPCKLKRAINRILSDETNNNDTETIIEVPWNTKKGDDNNGKKTQG